MQEHRQQASYSHCDDPSGDPAVLTAPHPDVEALEEAFVAQWSVYGRAPGGAFRNEDGLVWSEAPVRELPYNAVLRTKLNVDCESRIDDLVRRFRQRDVQFLWLLHPTALPANLDLLICARGLRQVDSATGMSLDVSGWRPLSAAPAGAVEYREVTDLTDLRDFETLMAAYWELSEESRAYVFGMSRWAFDSGDLGVRWVAYLHGEPIGKAYLSYLGPGDTAAIFGVYVGPRARGHGVAGTLTRLAIDRAAAAGRRRVVLHSSDMALGIYRRLGFQARCKIPIYATSPLHNVQPM